MSTTPRARAAAVLDLSATADGPVARAAFLRRLTDDNFVPPEVAVAAVNALAGTAIPLTPEATAEAMPALREEVDAFAAQYWALAPAARRERWANLSSRCDAGPDAVFLAQLELGLDLAIVPFSDADAAELAEKARGLYVLRPRERAVSRAEWLADWLRGRDWRPAVHELREADPSTAELEPTLLDRLETDRRVPISVKAASARVLAKAGAAKAREAAKLVSEEPSGSSGRGTRSAASILATVALLVAFKACNGAMRKPMLPALPYATPPRSNYQDQLDAISFTDQQIKAFLDYDRTHLTPATRTSSQPPPYYAAWVLAGKPTTPRYGSGGKR
jgi:hypothetical protein